MGVRTRPVKDRQGASEAPALELVAARPSVQTVRPIDGHACTRLCFAKAPQRTFWPTSTAPRSWTCRAALFSPGHCVPLGQMSSTPLLPGHRDDDIGPWCAGVVGLDRLPSRGRSALLLRASSVGLPSGRRRGLGRAAPDYPAHSGRDFFTHFGGSDVPIARDALEAASNQGWSTERIRDEATFCRLIIHANDNLLIDLAPDSPPGQPATASLVGRTSPLKNSLTAKSWPSSIGPRLATLLASLSSQSTSPMMTSWTSPPWSIRASRNAYSRRCSESLVRFSDQDLPAPETLIQRSEASSQTGPKN
jgi:hypothetical protein